MAAQTARFTANQTATVSRAIEAHNVVKELGEGENQVQVLRGVDLVVPTGEMLAIMGPSGSGKSTLLGCISGLDGVTDGRFVDTSIPPESHSGRAGEWS